MSIQRSIHSLLVVALAVSWSAQAGESATGATTHWSFVPPVRPALPAVRNTQWVRNPIDAFVLARLEAMDLEPSPQADAVTLVRRLHLDLTGLPPAPAEVDAALRDGDGGSWAAVTERLLASPHYGERWGRWWLDVARYADSNGYSIDAPRSIWPYRDWVIRAMNDDMPFDQFTLEQLAGDLLPDPTRDQLVATGFHRNTQINEEGGIDPEQFRNDAVVDRVATTGTAFLGLTLGCAQCHEHKFDPISQEEFYSMFAFFNDQDEPTLEVPTAEEAARRAAFDQRVAELEARINAAEADPCKEDTAARTELDKLKKKRPAVTRTMVLRERAEPRDTRVQIKGDFTRQGDPVKPGVPAVLPPLRTQSERASRLDLAGWLVDPSHPLTARVVVNRIWQQYFGRGLVETENDFGTQGMPPTHPDLLDWLAVELVESGWSLNHMHRLIVSSATYQQSSRLRPDLKERDPGNKWLARQRRLRLDAEVVRDVELAASGMLVPALGGPPVYPPQPDGVMTLGQVQRSWEASEGANRYRRGVYTHFWRATPHPALMVFDAPDGFSSCSRRLRSNTPLQALTLLNDAQFHELARALARRVAREAPVDTGDRLAYAFRLCVARTPLPEETARLRDLLESETDPQEGWLSVCRVLLNLDETITRE